MFESKALNLGFISISYYAVCILVGALIALYFIRKEWIKKGFDVKDANDFFFNVILVGIIGARVWYIIFMLPFYLSQPLQMFAIWEGGLAFHGGFIAGIIYGYYYFKKRGYDFWDVADTILPHVLIAQAIGRWGNFFNQEAFGGEVSLGFLKSLKLPDFIIDKMFIDGAYHHPTFLYESILCIISFFVIKLIVKNVRLKIGQTALLYGIFYSFARILVEQLRTDSLFIFGIKTAQLTSVIIIIASVYLFYRFDKTKEKNTLQTRMIEDGK